MTKAAGKVFIGDRIVGANGKMFQTEHQFGRVRNGGRGGGDKKGWGGPLMELAHAIEDSQGEDGKLELIIIPKKGGRPTPVTVKLKAVGRFGPNWPYDCKRSERLYRRLCEYLLVNRTWGGKMQWHEQTAGCLALMASGEKRYLKVAEQFVRGRLLKRRYNPNASGFASWSWGFDSILLGEWYLLTRDRAYLPAIKSLINAQALGQDPRNGGYSHRPFPFIRQRVAAGGGAGYGPMSSPGGLNFLGMSLFKAAGIPIDERAYEWYHQGYLRGAGRSQSGGVGYSFPSLPYVFADVSNPEEVKSSRGVGYLCQVGTKGIKGKAPENKGESPCFGGSTSMPRTCMSTMPVAAYACLCGTSESRNPPVRITPKATPEAPGKWAWVPWRI